VVWPLTCPLPPIPAPPRPAPPPKAPPGPDNPLPNLPFPNPARPPGIVGIGGSGEPEPFISLLCLLSLSSKLLFLLLPEPMDSLSKAVVDVASEESSYTGGPAGGGGGGGRAACFSLASRCRAVSSACTRSRSSRCWLRIRSTLKPRFLSAMSGVERILQVSSRTQGRSVAYEYSSNASSAFGVLSRIPQSAEAMLLLAHSSLVKADSLVVVRLRSQRYSQQNRFAPGPSRCRRIQCLPLSKRTVIRRLASLTSVW